MKFQQIQLLIRQTKHYQIIDASQNNTNENKQTLMQHLKLSSYNTSNHTTKHYQTLTKQ